MKAKDLLEFLKKLPAKDLELPVRWACYEGPQDPRVYRLGDVSVRRTFVQREELHNKPFILLGQDYDAE